MPDPYTHTGIKATLEAAKALLDEYMSQPQNPYLWVREGDKP